MPNLLIYTNSLLPASETFIRNPPDYFERYTPYFIGSLREEGLGLPEDRVLVANGQGLWGRLQQRFWLQFTHDFGVARLAKPLKSLSPVLLQAHYGHSAVYALPLRQRLKIPLLVYYHGLDATTTDERLSQSSYMRVYLQRRELLKRETRLFLTQSNFLKQCLITQGFPEEKIRTHYIGTHTAGDEPLPLEQREPMVLFVARLTKKKGGEYLIDAMKLVQEKHPTMRLVIVGDGPARSRWEQYASENLSNYEFIGWQNSEQVAAWMKKARIFCVPSVVAPSGDSEGFGMVFVEAQRWGTPVVSFAHGGIPEAVATGETGLLAPERDTATLAKYMIQLIDDDALWQKFSDAAYTRVKAKFDIGKLAQQLEGIYDEVLNYP